MAEFSHELKIPKERVAVLIGKKGEIKKLIEESTNTKLRINSEEGDVLIKGEDGLGIYTAKEMITAIGRGFNPEIAEQLLKPDYLFDTLTIKDYAKNKGQMIRLKGRVIGEQGKCRRIIEELTETHISVYGKTICIIGEAENVKISRKAVESLLSGSNHPTVYRWLEKKHKELKLKQLTGKNYG